MKASCKRCNPNLAIVLAAALFAPLQVSASSPEPAGYSGLHAMTEADLAGVAARGLDDFLSGTSNTGGRKMIGKLASSLNTVQKFLDVETTMTDVAYDPARAKTFLNADGSIVQILPNTIGEISFDHVRVKGAAPGANFGSFSIKAIDFTNSTLTLSPRH